MHPIEFPEQTTTFAKDQPEYRTLPAHIIPIDPDGRMTCCWKLSLRERLTLLLTGVIWQQVLTFHTPLQPQLLLAEKPDLVTPNTLQSMAPTKVKDPNGDFPRCVPVIGSKHCKLCGVYISTSKVYPCPAVPRKDRWRLQS